MVALAWEKEPSPREDVVAGWLRIGGGYQGHSKTNERAVDYYLDVAAGVFHMCYTKGRLEEWNCAPLPKNSLAQPTQ